MRVILIVVLLFVGCSSNNVVQSPTDCQNEVARLKAELARIDSTTPPMIIGPITEDK